MQDLPGNDLLELVVRYIGLEHIPRGAILVQKHYIWLDLDMGLSTDIP